MELHEFGIGNNGACTCGHSNTLAARFLRIGGDFIQATDAACCENGRVSCELFTPPIGMAQNDADHAAMMKNEIFGRMVIENFN
jgi:hypothetical protein